MSFQKSERMFNPIYPSLEVVTKATAGSFITKPELVSV